MANKATVTYASGLMLIMPNSGMYPLLLLEWISRQNAKFLHKVINEPDQCQMKIRFNCHSREVFDECAAYLNDNA